MKSWMVWAALIFSCLGNAAEPTGAKSFEQRVAASKGGSAALEHCTIRSFMDEDGDGSYDALRGMWGMKGVSIKEMDALEGRAESGCRQCIVRAFKTPAPADRKYALAELTPEEVEALDRLPEAEQERIGRLVQNVMSLGVNCVMKMGADFSHDVDRSLHAR